MPNQLSQLVNLMSIAKSAREMGQGQQQQASMEDTLNQLQSVMQKIPSGRIEGNLAKGAAYLGMGPAPQVQKYKTLSALLFGPMARQVMMEKGVLSEQDINRIREAMPQITSTQDERKAAFEELFRKIRMMQGQSTGGGEELAP